MREPRCNSVEEALSNIVAKYQKSNAAALVCDFDGTLAPIVNDPTQSKIPQQVAEALILLTQKIEIVAVVSGRELEFLNQAFAPYIDKPEALPIKIFGLYGNQTNDETFANLHKPSTIEKNLVKNILEYIAPLPEKINVEIKDGGIVLHYRNNPDLEEEVFATAQKIVHTFPVCLIQGRKVMELVPVGHIDKGDVIDYIAGYVDTVCYIGDDYGDIAAFDKVNSSAQDGLSIGVFSEEMPAALYDKCQIILANTEAVHKLILELLIALS